MEEKLLTKNDLCRVLIRFTGIYFVFSAVLGCAIVIVTTIISGIVTGVSLKGPMMTTLFSTIVASLVPLAIGVYLLQAGKTVHRWLMNTGDSDVFNGQKFDDESSEKPIKVTVNPRTTLTESETTAFSKWLENHPECRKRSLDDQIALFRDFQKE